MDRLHTWCTTSKPGPASRQRVFRRLYTLLLQEPSLTMPRRLSAKAVSTEADATSRVAKLDRTTRWRFWGSVVPVLKLSDHPRRKAEREDLLRPVCWNHLRTPQCDLNPRMPVVTVNRIARRWAWPSSSSFDELKTIFPPNQWPRRKRGLVRLDPSNHSKNRANASENYYDRSELRIDAVGDAFVPTLNELEKS